MAAAAGLAIAVAAAWGCAAFSEIRTGTFLGPGIGESLAVWPRHWTVCRTCLEQRGIGLRSRLLSECVWMGSTLGSSPLTAPNRTLCEVASGWPWPAMRYVEWWSGEPDSGTARWRQGIAIPAGRLVPTYPARRLPTDPLLKGLIADGAVFAALVYGAAFGPRDVRRYLRARRGCCVGCGYDLKGSASGVCPECGLAGERL